MTEQIEQLRAEMSDVLENNILRFWLEKSIDNKNGGFVGRIDGNDNIVENAPKGAVLNARILWAFAAAYRIFGKDEYLQAATRAKRYLIDHFYDHQYGGVYWSLNANAEPLETKKQIYALGFAIYGLSEYYRATNDKEALEYAIKLFGSIETHSLDKINGGYWEALTRQWDKIDDMRLSDKDDNEAKTTNTHLHIIEPYTNLYRVWPDESLRRAILNLLEIFDRKIVTSSEGNLELFFDEHWTSKSPVVSFGHDIEASWLLDRAVESVNLPRDRYATMIRSLHTSAMRGYSNGRLSYEYNRSTGIFDHDAHWWVQAENVIGSFNIYQLTGNVQSLNVALQSWQFIKENLIDYQNGEWWWSIKSNGEINHTDDKAGFWKCPYHNSRMCMEIIERTTKAE